MEFDVKVESCGVPPQGRLVKRHYVGERHSPQVIETDDHIAKHCREIPPLLVI